MTNHSKTKQKRFWDLWRKSGAIGTINRYPAAVVREINGQLVLDDPMTVAMIRVIEKENCKNIFTLQKDRVEHFKKRMIEQGLSSEEAVIVLINADDVHGSDIAEHLMPGTDWQAMRDKGEIPFARGLATKEGLVGILKLFDKEASKKLQKMTSTAVVVVDHGVAEIFDADNSDNKKETPSRFAGRVKQFMNGTGDW
jgi:hypothetical protein